ncbi:hypothetical protein WA158_001505 [Blastocystis sp. Blastoise]
MAEKDQSAIIEALKAELQAEKEKNENLENKLIEARKIIVTNQTLSEAEEEKISLSLLKKLEEVKQEKRKLAEQIDTEEEALTNGLQRRLADVMASKIELEKKLEYEQEYMVNRLQRKIKEIEQEKESLKEQLSVDTEHLINSINSAISMLETMSKDPNYSPQIESDKEGLEVPCFINKLIEEAKKLGQRLKEIEQEKAQSIEKNKKLQTELESVNNENFALQQRIKEGNKQVQEAWKMVGEIERNYETLSENGFNSEVITTPTSPREIIQRLRSASIESRERSASLLKDPTL